MKRKREERDAKANEEEEEEAVSYTNAARNCAQKMCKNECERIYLTEPHAFRCRAYAFNAILTQIFSKMHCNHIVLGLGGMRWEYGPEGRREA